MNDIEKRALEWLKSQGHTGIIYQHRSSPDFMTSDGKGFEAKLSHNNVIWFGTRQLKKLSQFEGELTILIFHQTGGSPVDLLPFDDIRYGQRSWRNYRIEGWDSNVQPPTASITEEEAKGMKQLVTLEGVAERLCISVAAARMLVLHDGAIPYIKISQRSVRVKEDDLEAYITKLAKQPAKEKEEVKPTDTREPFKGGILR